MKLDDEDEETWFPPDTEYRSDVGDLFSGLWMVNQHRRDMIENPFWKFSHMMWRTWVRRTLHDGAHTITITGTEYPVGLARIKFRLGTHISMTNFPGNDYRQGLVRDYDDCANRCFDSDMCAGFSYHDDHKYCWLKRAMMNTYRNDKVSSWARDGTNVQGDIGGEYLNNWSYFGGEQLGGNMYFNNFRECARECDKNEQCAGMNFNKNPETEKMFNSDAGRLGRWETVEGGHKCRLMKSMTDKRRDNKRVTWVKNP